MQWKWFQQRYFLLHISLLLATCSQDVLERGLDILSKEQLESTTAPQAIGTAPQAIGTWLKQQVLMAYVATDQSTKYDSKDTEHTSQEGGTDDEEDPGAEYA